MNRISLWFKKKKLKPIPIIIVGLILLALIIIIINLLTQEDEEPKSLSMIEDGELRTGPAAFYPIIFDLKDGD